MDRWEQTPLDEARRVGAQPVVEYLTARVPCECGDAVATSSADTFCCVGHAVSNEKFSQWLDVYNHSPFQHAVTLVKVSRLHQYDDGERITCILFFVDVLCPTTNSAFTNQSTAFCCARSNMRQRCWRQVSSVASPSHAERRKPRRHQHATTPS